jgi:hypothetical protein
VATQPTAVAATRDLSLYSVNSINSDEIIESEIEIPPPDIHFAIRLAALNQI